MHQESTGQNSVTLLWQEPDQPNGIILEYEIKYYEKVTLSLSLREAPAVSQPCTRGFSAGLCGLCAGAEKVLSLIFPRIRKCRATPL